MNHPRTKLAALIVGLLASAFAPEARGAPKSSRPKLAILETKAVGKFDPAAVAGLSSLVASEATRSPVQVVSGSDVAALMGLERQRQLLSCSDSSCLAEIGGALGVNYLLTAEVAQVGGQWLVTLALLDVGRATSVARLTRRTPQESRLVDESLIAVHEMMGGVFGSLEARPPPAAAKPAPAPAPAAEAVAPAESGGHALGYTLDALGGALLVSAAVAGWLGRDAYLEAESLAKSGDPAKRADFDALKASADDRLLAADLLLAGGVVAAGLGLYFTFSSPEAEGAALIAAPARDGGALFVSGRF
jgi:hypothetical protein